MLNTMINSSVTMGQLQHKMDSISNNMANIDTAGFKRKETSFNSLLYQQINNQSDERKEIGRLTPLGIRQGVGAALAQASLQMEQGSIKQTDRALDVAIIGKNQFFQVNKNGNESFLTRDGKFYLSPKEDGISLVTGRGEYVQGKNGNVELPLDTKDIVISNSGEVTAINSNGDAVVVDQLDVASVIRPQMLNAVGGNKFQLPDNIGDLGLEEDDIVGITNVDDISLRQGSLEMSNVDMSKEMTELMMSQKSYQFNARSLSMANDMFGLVNQLR